VLSSSLKYTDPPEITQHDDAENTLTTVLLLLLLLYITLPAWIVKHDEFTKEER